MTLPTSPADSWRGIYVHIPFCVVRCPYCDFNAYSGMDDLAPQYVEALRREIEFSADGGPVSTIFFGGGTPTQLPPAMLSRLLGVFRRSFNVDRDAEVTLEANPETVDERVFSQLLEGGFNRTSVGVQSLSAAVLRRLGRVHSTERAIGALAAARAAGFERVNADLIFGTPGETPAEWRESLEGVIAEGVDHISCYALTVEDGTPLASWVARGIVAPPDEDDQAAKYEIAHTLLTRAGFVRYEISNWARPGSWSRHNAGYWAAGDYLGFGAGAHGHRSGRRWWNVRNPRTYIERSPFVEEGFEELGLPERVEEAMLLGLRLAAGIDLERFSRVWSTDPLHQWGPEIEGLIDEALLEIVDGHLRLSERGYLFASYVSRTLMAERIPAI